MLVGDFSSRYDVSLEELITLNNFTDETDAIDAGQQIFVPLNRVEAQDR
jgi:LysM repeat protein